MNPVDSEISLIDGIPFVGHIKALIYKIRGRNEIAVKAFNSATHSTSVTCCGLLGGYLAGPAGSGVGGVIGGLFVDVPISVITARRYGYLGFFNTFRGLDLIRYIVKDAFTGLFASIAYNECKIPMLLLNNIETQETIPCYTVKEEKDRGFNIRINFNTNVTADPCKPSAVDGIPILGYVNILIRYHQGNTNAVKSLKEVTHRTGVMYCGVLGGILAESVYGSIVGGIIGGVLVDAIISKKTATRYGYIDYMGWNTDYLIDLAFEDGITGLFTFIAFTILKKPMQSYFTTKNQYELYQIISKEETGKDMSGIIYLLKIQKDMYGMVYMYALRIKKDQDYRDRINVAKVLTVVMKLHFAITKLIVDLPPESQHVDTISELQPGDHIVYKRWRFMEFNVYDHHAIVGEVFREDGEYVVYEQVPSFHLKKSKSNGKASIQKNKMPFDNMSVYKIDHGEAATPNFWVRQTADYIYKNAETTYFKRKYHFISNNCEHFANFCAKDKIESQQVQQTTAILIPVILSTLVICSGNVSSVIFFISRMADSFVINTLTEITLVYGFFSYLNKKVNVA